jgi:hypothetical protein
MHSVIGDMVCFCPRLPHPKTDSLSANDYIQGMWLILQQSVPEDFVLATGETHPVREFVEKSFKVVGTEIKYVSVSAYHALALKAAPQRWRGSGVKEEGYDAATGTVVVRIDERYFRPAEVEYVTFLLGLCYMLSFFIAYCLGTQQKLSASLGGSAKSTLTRS